MLVDRIRIVARLVGNENHGLDAAILVGTEEPPYVFQFATKTQKNPTVFGSSELENFCPEVVDYLTSESKLNAALSDGACLDFACQ